MKRKYDKDPKVVKILTGCQSHSIPQPQAQNQWAMDKDLLDAKVKSTDVTGIERCAVSSLDVSDDADLWGEIVTLWTLMRGFAGILHTQTLSASTTSEHLERNWKQNKQWWYERNSTYWVPLWAFCIAHHSFSICVSILRFEGSGVSKRKRR